MRFAGEMSGDVRIFRDGRNWKCSNQRWNGDSNGERVDGGTAELQCFLFDRSKLRGGDIGDGVGHDSLNLLN